MSYNVICIKCGKSYVSKANRNGLCEDCKVSSSQRSLNSRTKNYDSVIVYLPKGKRDKLKLFSGLCGMTMNEFINKAIDSYSAEALGECSSENNEELLKQTFEDMQSI